jgi:hypothetical protein
MERSGYVWKKNGTRAGIGRNFAKGWSQRFVAVEGSVLRYALESDSEPKFEKDFSSAKMEKHSGKDSSHNFGLAVSWADGTKVFLPPSFLRATC